jgi:uncharacterized protein
MSSTSLARPTRYTPHSRKAGKSKRTLKIVAAAVTAIAVSYLLTSFTVAYILWHPIRHAIHTSPGEYGLSYEDISFTSAVDNIPLKGWFIDTPGEDAIVVLHGSNSARDNYMNMEMSRELAVRGYDILLFDFRGHGESGGDTFSLGNWETRDVAGALSYLKKRGAERVGVYAHSMGAATALLAAPGHPEVSTIVADSSFARLTTMIDDRVKQGTPFTDIIHPGVMAMSEIAFGTDPADTQPVLAISRLKDRSILLIHSSGDTVIPPSESQKLYEAGAGNPNLELWVAPGVGHTTAFADNREAYVERVTAFFGSHLDNTK